MQAFQCYFATEMPADTHEYRSAHRRHKLHGILPLLPKEFQEYSQKYVVGKYHACAYLCIVLQVCSVEGKAMHTGIHAINIAWKPVHNFVREEKAGSCRVVRVGSWLFLNEY